LRFIEHKFSTGEYTCESVFDCGGLLFNSKSRLWMVGHTPCSCRGSMELHLRYWSALLSPARRDWYSHREDDGASCLRSGPVTGVRSASFASLASDLVWRPSRLGECAPDPGVLTGWRVRTRPQGCPMSVVHKNWPIGTANFEHARSAHLSQLVAL
jgi:hypothetical protein